MHHYLRHLANFARIVEAGSMRAASELIGIAPSGLSDSVRILETKLGAPLLVRHRGGVAPTSEGERVYEAASAIVSLLDDAMGKGQPEALSGPCRLSLPTEIATTCAGAILAHLGAAHPGLDVTVFAEDDLVDHSRFGRDYFLRLTARPERYDGLRELWTGSTSAILVASAALLSATEAQSVEKIAALPCITGAGRKAPITYALTGPDATLSFARSISVSLAAARLSLAERGHGVTGCLAICAADALRQGRLRHLLPDRFSLPVTIHLLTPHKRKRRLDDPVIAAAQAAFAS